MTHGPRGPSRGEAAAVVLAAAALGIAAVHPDLRYATPWIVARWGLLLLGLVVVARGVRDLARGVAGVWPAPERVDALGIALAVPLAAAAGWQRSLRLLDADEFSGLPNPTTSPWLTLVADDGLPSRVWGLAVGVAHLVGRTEVLLALHLVGLVALALIVTRLARDAVGGVATAAVAASVLLTPDTAFSLQQLRSYALFLPLGALGALGTLPRHQRPGGPGPAWVLLGFGLGALDDPVLVVPLVAAGLAGTTRGAEARDRAALGWALLVAACAAPSVAAAFSAHAAPPAGVDGPPALEPARWGVPLPLAGALGTLWVLLAAPATPGGSRPWAATTSLLGAVVLLAARGAIENDERVLLVALPLAIAWPAALLADAARRAPALGEAAVAGVAVVLLVDQAAVHPTPWAPAAGLVTAAYVAALLAHRGRVAPRTVPVGLAAVATVAVVGLRAMDTLEGSRTLRGAWSAYVDAHARLLASPPEGPVVCADPAVEGLLFGASVRDRFATAVAGAPVPWDPSLERAGPIRFRVFDPCTGEHPFVLTRRIPGREDPRCARCDRVWSEGAVVELRDCRRLTEVP